MAPEVFAAEITRAMRLCTERIPHFDLENISCWYNVASDTYFVDDDIETVRLTPVQAQAYFKWLNDGRTHEQYCMDMRLKYSKEGNCIE